MYLRNNIKKFIRFEVWNERAAETARKEIEIHARNHGEKLTQFLNVKNVRAVGRGRTSSGKMGKNR